MRMNTIRAAFAASAIVLASFAWGSAVVNVPPDGDLAAAVAAAADDTVFQLSEGEYAFPAQIAITGKSNLRFVGAGPDETVFVRKDGAVTRFFRLENSTDIGFDGVAFKGGRIVSVGGNDESFQGGAIWSSAVTGLAFRNCDFLDNEIVDDSVSAAGSATTLKGGALYAVDTTLACVDCRFERNSAYDSKTDKSQYPPCGGAVYLDNVTDAPSSAIRITAAFTNVVFLANHGGAKSTYSLRNSIVGAAVYGASAGIEVYNGLFTGQYSSGNFALYTVVYNNGTGAFSRYTQCSFVDNAGYLPHAGGSPVFVRTVFSGQEDVFKMENTWDKTYSVLIDSVFTTRSGGYTAPADTKAICGTTFASSNWAYADPGIVNEGEARGLESVARDAGWRPTAGRVYRTLYVAATGDDAAGTGAESAPFRSLTRAWAEVRSGETIRLGAGVYGPSSGEIFPLVMEDKHHVLIEGEGRDATVLTGEGIDSDTFLRAARVTGLRVAWLTITGANVNTLSKENRPAILCLDDSGTVRFDLVAVTGNVARADSTAESLGLMKIRSSTFEFRDCDLSDNAYRMAQNWSHCSFVRGLVVNAANSSLLMDRCRCERIVGDANGGLPSHGRITYGNYPAEPYCLFVLYNGGKFCLLDVRNSFLDRVGRLVNPYSDSCYGQQYCCVMDINASSADFAAHFENNTVICDAKVPFFRSLAMTVANSIFVGKDTILRGSYESWEPKPNAYNTIFESTLEEDPGLANFSNLSTEETVCTGTTTAFTDAENGDYTLTAKSTEAIDQGAVRSWISLDGSQKDLLGNPRCVGYLVKKNKIPDLGCYELPRPQSGLWVTVR